MSAPSASDDRLGRFLTHHPRVASPPLTVYWLWNIKGALHKGVEVYVCPGDTIQWTELITMTSYTRSLMSRRQLLQFFGAGGLLLSSGGLLAACRSSDARPLEGRPPRPVTPTMPPTVAPGATAENQTENPADVEIRLTAVAAQVGLLPGRPTAIWSYQPARIRGDASIVQTLPESALGPIIRVRRGQRVRVHFTNSLPDPAQRSIIHWHGLVVPAAMDGHPRYAVAPGQTFTYDFTVNNRAGTAWFHPHPHGQTGHQVYRGLAGLFLISDDEERALGLPDGAYDLPLVIQDRTFDAANQLVYLPDSGPGGMRGGMGRMGGMGHGGMMATMMGFLGERILVNGRPDYTISVATRAYRLRLLNGSNARIYKLAWSTSEPLTVLGSDGGLLAAAVNRPYVMLAPGERVELWADFSRYPIGTTLTLESLAFSGAEDPGGMMGGGLSMGAAPPQGAPLRLLTVRVERAEAAGPPLPGRLASLERLRSADAVNAGQPRPVRLQLNGMQWLLNGRTFEMDGVTPEETVRQGSVEQWQIVNERNPGAMMDANGMAHPIHIHGVQFQVVDRQVASDLATGWESVRAGHVDEGWKDTVLVMPGERVALLMRFEQPPGLYLYHCHNLEHEDSGMMRNYQVLA